MWSLLLLAPVIELDWDVPDDCPSEAAFVEMVEAEARVQAEADDPPVLSASVEIEKRGDERWALKLELRRGEELDVRTMNGESCEAVVDAAALVVSLRVVEWTQSKPPATDSAPEPALEPPPPLPMTTAPEAEPEPEPAPSQPEPTAHAEPVELGGWIGVHGGLALGVGPGLGGAVAIDGGMAGRRWRTGLGIQAMPRRLTDHPNDESVRGRFDLLVGEALGCGVPSVGPVEFPLCGRIAVGGLRGVGEGNVAEPEPAWRRWVGLGGSLGASWKVTERLAPALTVEGLAPLQSRAFSVGGIPGILHETGVFALRAWLGLEIHL